MRFVRCHRTCCDMRHVCWNTNFILQRFLSKSPLLLVKSTVFLNKKKEHAVLSLATHHICSLPQFWCCCCSLSLSLSLSFSLLLSLALSLSLSLSFCHCPNRLQTRTTWFLQKYIAYIALALESWHYVGFMFVLPSVHPSIFLVSSHNCWQRPFLSC